MHQLKTRAYRPQHHLLIHAIFCIKKSDYEDFDDPETHFIYSPFFPNQH